MAADARQKQMAITGRMRASSLPGTFPIVVTDEQDWGGWRVPGAEYDRDPQLIELQARIITAAPVLMSLAEKMAEQAEKPDELPDDFRALVEFARNALKRIKSRPADTRQTNNRAA